MSRDAALTVFADTHRWSRAATTFLATLGSLARSANVSSCELRSLDRCVQRVLTAHSERASKALTAMAPATVQRGTQDQLVNTQMLSRVRATVGRTTTVRLCVMFASHCCCRFMQLPYGLCCAQLRLMRAKLHQLPQLHLLPNQPLQPARLMRRCQLLVHRSVCYVTLGVSHVLTTGTLANIVTNAQTITFPIQPAHVRPNLFDWFSSLRDRLCWREHMQRTRNVRQRRQLCLQ